MNKSNYTPKGRRRQGAVSHANRIRAATCPTFAARDYGELKPGGNPTGYFSCQILGYEVKLRFNMVWTAYCPHFDIEIQFTHRSDNAKIVFLTDWITALIEAPQSPAAKLRQATPAVLYLADYHDIAIPLAREIYEERGR